MFKLRIYSFTFLETKICFILTLLREFLKLQKMISPPKKKALLKQNFNMKHMSVED